MNLNILNMNSDKNNKKKCKKYYDKNKEKICEKLRVKITCELCNCEVNTNALSRHNKTKKHQARCDELAR